jgi:hypothetical protein
MYQTPGGNLAGVTPRYSNDQHHAGVTAGLEAGVYPGAPPPPAPATGEPGVGLPPGSNVGVVTDGPGSPGYVAPVTGVALSSVPQGQSTQTFGTGGDVGIGDVDPSIYVNFDGQFVQGGSTTGQTIKAGDKVGVIRMNKGGVTFDPVTMSGDSAQRNPAAGGAKPEITITPPGVPKVILNNNETREVMDGGPRAQTMMQQGQQAAAAAMGQRPNVGGLRQMIMQRVQNQMPQVGQTPVQTQPMPQQPPGQDMSGWQGALRAFIEQARAQAQQPDFQQWLQPQMQTLMQAHPAYQRAMQQPGFVPPQIPQAPQIPRFAGGTGLSSMFSSLLGSRTGSFGSSFGTVGAPIGGGTNPATGLPYVQSSTGSYNTVQQTRENTPVPGSFNPFDVGFDYLDPTVKETGYAARQSKYAIPIESQRAEAARLRLPGALQQQIMMAY